jgi:hypothetical protein
VGDENGEVGGRAGPTHVLEQRRGRLRGRHVRGARAWWSCEEDAVAACERREVGDCRRRLVVVAAI